jgi:hypothetical protein
MSSVAMRSVRTVRRRTARGSALLLALFLALGGFQMQVCLCSDHSDGDGRAQAASRKGHNELAHHGPSDPRSDRGGGANHESGSSDVGRGPALAPDDRHCRCVGASFVYVLEDARKNAKGTTGPDFEVSAVVGGPHSEARFAGRRRSAHSWGTPEPPQAQHLFLLNCAFLL